MKNFMKRIWLFIKHIVAVFVDIIFPIIDLLQAILLILPIPGAKKIVIWSQKYEDILVLWVEKIKEIQKQVDGEEPEKIEEKEEEKKEE